MSSGVSARVPGMRAALLALLVLARTDPPAGHALTAATMLRFNTDKENLKIANRSLEFVKIIREDLRRNNDDYVAAGGGAARQERARAPGGAWVPSGARAPGGAWAPGGAPAPAPGRASRGGPPRPPRPPRAPLSRTQLARDPVKRVSPKRDLLKHPVDTRRNLNDTGNETTAKPIIQNVTIFRSHLHPVRHYKKVRVDKIKRIIDKGKRLRELGRTAAGGTTPMGGALPNLGEVMNNANENVETGANVAQGTNGEGAGAGEAAVDTLATPVQAASKPAAAAAAAAGASDERGGQAAAALRQHAALVSPSPDQLDMAPARGPEIQLIRFKGRLCQRSVLNIEGPVYDAQGSSVVPAYKPEFGRGRLFPNTRAPDMLLPRCCNCCKKSVLGCQ